MSLGGANLFAGNDPIYAPLVREAQQAGIVLTISAGNDGPAGLTIGTPGDSKGILTAGASSDAPHSRVVGDLLIGPGLGVYYRPVDNNIIADFSSRGPTADGRMGLNIVAPGDWRFAQGANTGISWVSGTSFSAPTVAGAAALLLSAHPKATDEQIRGALLMGANGKVIDGKPQKVDQGFGMLDVMAAERKFGAFNPPDFGLSTPLVRLNVLPFGITAFDGGGFAGNTGWLLPGQRKEFYLETTTQPLTGLTVQVTVTPELPAEQQNQLFGDDAEVTVATAKTSFGDYVLFDFASGSKTYTINEDDLDMGLTRVCVTGDFTNAGRIKASVQVTKNPASLRLCPIIRGKIAQGQELDYPLTVPAGTTEAHFKLFWINGWETWPTNDLDILFTDPDGNLVLPDPDADGDIEGAGLDAPERVTLVSPKAGTWTMSILGSTVWSNRTNFTLYTDLYAPSHLAQKAGSAAAEKAGELPARFALEQNYPNPFNPSTIIRYSLPVNVHVQLNVYNTLGQQISTLVNEEQSAGVHEVVFQNPGLASGVYFYRLQAGTFQDMRKLVLLK